MKKKTRSNSTTDSTTRSTVKNTGKIKQDSSTILATTRNIRWQEYDVYCGRAGHGKDGYFGNPYMNGSREDNISNFKAYFYHRLKSDKEFKRRVHELRGKRLGCFCHPLDCHVDIIVEYLNKL